MPAAAPPRTHAERFSEGADTLRGVDVFAAGTHRGKDYTPADLDDMARNFARHSAGPAPRLRVPAVIGHEETQAFLDRTDTPAAGWCTRVWRAGNKLKADFSDVPPKVMRLLRGKRYRTVSSEVYDAPPDGLPGGKGKMLRRVAFLGGEIPQVKSLDDIPVPEAHAEGDPRFAPRARVVFKFSEIQRTPVPGLFRVFAEMSPMDPETQKLLEQLGQMGCDTEALKGCPPEYLTEFLRCMGDRDDGGGDDDDFAEFDGFDEDNLPDAPEGKGEEYADRARRYAECQKMKAGRGMKFLEKYCGKMAEGDAEAQQLDTQGLVKTAVNQAEPPAPGGDPMPKQTTVTHKFTEQHVKRIVAAAVAEVRKDFAAVREQTDQLTANTKKANIDVFCERMVKEGKVLPAALDRGPDGKRPTLADRLMRADARAVVQKFHEKGGKTAELTELDLQMREIEAGPVLTKFGEKVSAGKAGVAAAEDDEAAKVEAHYEQFSERFEKLQTTKEDFVAAFKSKRKRDPELTAERHLANR